MAYFSSVECSGGDEENARDAMRDMFGPGHVDQSVRSAIQACWMALPKERRSVEAVEIEIRRIMERALASFREDAAAFGSPEKIVPEPKADAGSQ